MITFKRLESHQTEQAIELMNLWYPQLDHSPAYMSELLMNRHHYMVTIRKHHKLIGGVTAYRLKMFSRLSDELFIYEVGIEEEFQGIGYGKQLMNYIIDLAAADGCKEVFVITEQSNQKANNLYRSLGCKGEPSVCYTKAFNNK